MPIVDVEIVAPHARLAGLAQRLADALGPVLGAPRGGTWVRLRELPRTHYAEAGGGDGAEPVFVTILRANVPFSEGLVIEAKDVAEAVAALVGRPTDLVHVLYEPAARGRIAFGGELLNAPRTPRF